VSMT